MSTHTVTVNDGTGERQIQFDATNEIYDPVRKVVYPIEKPVRQLIAELAARLETAEARIAALESAAKV